MCFMISSKLLYQIVRALLRFADPKHSLLAVFIVSEVALIKKLLVFNFEKIEIKFNDLRARLLFLTIFPELLCQIRQTIVAFC